MAQQKKVTITLLLLRRILSRALAAYSITAQASSFLPGVPTMPTTTTSELQQQGLYPVEGSNSTAARLFLGTQKAAQNRSLLRCHRVSRIVCVGTPAFHRVVDKAATQEPADDCRLGDELVYLEIPILDLPSENLLARLDDCVSFISSSMQHGHGVLVNCVYAQSRSAAGTRCLVLHVP